MRAVDDVDVEVLRGETVAVMGPSGTGKTIANGGIYLPPHVLLTQPAGANGQPSTQMKAEPFRADGDLADPLPAMTPRAVVRSP